MPCVGSKRPRACKLKQRRVAATASTAVVDAAAVRAANQKDVTDRALALCSAICNHDDERVAAMCEEDPSLLLAPNPFASYPSNGGNMIHALCSLTRGSPASALPRFIAAGARVNARDNKGQTPLHVAVDAWSGATNKVSMRRVQNAEGHDCGRGEGGAREEDAESSGDVIDPEAACHTEGVALIHALLAAGAQPNLRDDAGHIPLHIAVSRGNVALFHALIEHDAGAVYDVTEKGDTMLHILAASVGWGEEARVAIFRDLVAAGVDVHAVNGEGNTALHIAARKADAHAVNELLAAGACLDAVNAGGFPLFVTAAIACNTPLLTWLLTKEMVSPQWTDERGNTLMHYACGAYLERNIESFLLTHRRHFPSSIRDTCCALYACGVPLDARNAEGMTPLHIAAACWGESDVACALLSIGADASLLVEPEKGKREEDAAAVAACSDGDLVNSTDKVSPLYIAIDAATFAHAGIHPERYDLSTVDVLLKAERAAGINTVQWKDTDDAWDLVYP